MVDDERDLKEQQRQTAPKPAPGKLSKTAKDELAASMGELEAKLDEERAKSREYLDDARRHKAELENYRKRMIREQTRIIEQANCDLIRKLLPVIDDLEKAVQVAEGHEDQVADGIRMVYENLMKVLKQEGLEEIDPKGERFNPEHCEAVMATMSEEHADDTVLEVHQKGYKFRGNLLRPARATVSKCP
jgi:molecular chaperone GrpE